MREVAVALGATGLGEGALPPTLVEKVLASPPAYIEDVLAEIRREHGTVRAYLLAHGLLPAELEAVRQRLVVAAPVPVG